MRIIKSYEIERDMMLFITLKNGARIAGKALSRIQSGRGVGWHITVRGVARPGNVRVEGADIAEIATA